MSQTKAQLLNPQGDFTLTGQLIGVGATFSGNVSIAGTLTKQDVTNVDSVGVITARSDISIADKIIHTGDTNTAIRFPSADTFTVELGGSERVRVGSSGEYDDITGPSDAGIVIGGGSFASAGLQVRTSATGVGRIYFGDNSADDNGRKDGYIIYSQDSRSMQFATAQTERIRINSGGRVNIGHLNQTGSHLDYTKVNIYGQTSAGGTNKNLNLLNVYNYGDGNNGNIGGIGLGAGASPGSYTKASIGFVRTGTYGRGDLTFYINDQANGDQVAETDERLRITSDGKIGIGEDDPDGNYLLIRAASTVGTTKGHIMLTGDSATNGQGPQIVFSESGSGSSFAGAYVGHTREGSNSTGNLVFATRATGGDANTVPTVALTINSSQAATFTSSVSDSKGNLRSIPRNGQGSTYTLVASDAGKAIGATNTVTIPNGVMSSGDAVTIINENNSDITIAQGSGFTLYNASEGNNAAGGNRTLASRGLCTLYFPSNSQAYISGAGLS